MSYVVMSKDGEKVRSCASYRHAQAVLKYTKGGTIKTFGTEVIVPPTKWRKHPNLAVSADLRVKPYCPVQ